MGYVVKKIRMKPDGSVYWQVIYEDRRADRPKDQPRESVIHRDKLFAIGIDPADPFKKVKEICQQLNANERLRRSNERARVRSQRRVEQRDLVESALLPTRDVKEFEERILCKRFAEDEDSVKYRRLISHWLYAQRLIAKLQIEPRDYADEAFQIYRYFQNNKTSPAYAVKILRILNAWGQFMARRHGGTGIEEIKMPRGTARQRIERSYRSKENFKGEAAPLTPEELEAKSNELLDYNYKWLYLSVWLGLRPEEVDRLKEKKTWRLAKQDGEPILWVFQSKLVSVADEKAWKPIPLFLPQQKQCIELIKEANFRRPLNKVLRNVFPAKRITAYSGRKGFTDLMLAFGQELEQISVWLGHHSIETTWQHYKNKQVVKFNVPSQRSKLRAVT